MDPFTYVLGTSHALQGATKRTDNIDDPTYALVIKKLILEYSVDFIFEEASEQGPTTAEALAGAYQIEYVDMDLNEDHREQHGLPMYTARNFEICRASEPHAPRHEDLVEEYVSNQLKREQYWIDQIKRRVFKGALVICGYLHSFSVAHGLIAAGFSPMVLTYIPRIKLARACIETKGEWNAHR
jgi:hypothetical protein